MNAKLTLSLDSRVIQLAKKYAKQKGVSLSQIVEEYLEKFSSPKSTGKKRSAAELRGIAGNVSADFNPKEERYKYLSKKHG